MNNKFIKDIMSIPASDTVCHARVPLPEDTHMTASDGRKYQYMLTTIWLNTAGKNPSERMFILSEFYKDGDHLRSKWDSVVDDVSCITFDTQQTT